MLKCGRRSVVCSSDLFQPTQSSHGGRAGLALRNDIVRNAGICPGTPSRSGSAEGDRKSVVYGKSVDLGGRRIIKKKKHGELSWYRKTHHKHREKCNRW